jgi:hypothetical protein
MKLITQTLFVALYALGTLGSLALEKPHNWKPQSSGTYGRITRVRYGNGAFVALVPSTDAVLTSPDGIAWTSVSEPAMRNVNDIAFENGRWVAVGSDSLLVSSNGITWQAIETRPQPFNVVCISFGNGLWVAGGPNGTMFTSPDVINWTLRKNSNIWFSRLFFSSEQFMALSFGTQTSVSIDGTTWATFDQKVGLGISLTELAYANGQFVGVSIGGNFDSPLIFNSSDGIRWDFQQTSKDLYGICSVGDNFVAVGVGGTILSSSNAVTWTVEASASSQNLYSIAYGNGRFVAVGDSGTILATGPFFVPGVLSRIQFSHSLGFECSVSANPGQSFAFEVSTNLVKWNVLNVLNAGTNTSIKFTDQTAANFGQRYYRSAASNP